eukprot:COSAG06_NODE_37249_length_437_cov_1.127219_1_plen_27_part_01
MHLLCCGTVLWYNRCYVVVDMHNMRDW